MTSHVEAAIAARIARVRAEEERKRQEREEQATRRAAGLAKRHAAKLRALGRQLAPTLDPFTNTSPAASGA
ncbi:hypothetical protein [Streptomyces canus]|uniref:hypothetical protein n=1 Tax=Streptomyces canus TaxID=58343 RepID=UPI00036A169B|nr:hypothetical protein [Streptomyces canus]